MIVDQGTDSTPSGSGDQRVADLERAPLDEQIGNGTSTDVEVGLEHHATGPPVGRGSEILELGHHEQVLEQIVDAVALQRRHRHHDRVAAPRLGNEILLGELLHHAVRIGVLTIDLVDRDDDRYVRGLGVVQRLDRLGHHPVVRGDDEHHDVGGFGATGAHGGEGLVARRVDEGQRAAVLFDLVRTDVLGDTAGLTGDHVRVADAVEELGLAVIDVAHDGDDRRTMRLVGVLAFVVLVVELQQLLQLDLLLFARIDELDLGADLGREQLDHVVGQRLRGRDHLALLHQEPDDVGRGAVDLRSELLRRGGALDHHDTFGHRGLVGRVGRGVHRLQLVTATTATALSTLRRADVARHRDHDPGLRPDHHGREVHHRDRLRRDLHLAHRYHRGPGGRNDACLETVTCPGCDESCCRGHPDRCRHRDRQDDACPGAVESACPTTRRADAAAAGSACRRSTGRRRGRRRAG